MRDETVRAETVRDETVRDDVVLDEPVRDRADDDEGVTVTRSEEQVRVTGTERVATGKARLRKYVETEYRTVTVPVRTEKVALETEPVAEEDLDAAARAAAERKVREEG